MFTSNSTNFGIFDRYISSRIGKDTPEYNAEVKKVEKQVDTIADSIQGYFDVLYRVLNERSKKKLSQTIVKVYDSYSNSSGYLWSREYGSRAFESVKAFAGPVGQWEDKRDASAYAGVEDVPYVYYSKGRLLDGLSTLTHEHTHNLDKYILFDGYMRRAGHGPESFALGLLQSPDPGSEVLGINLIFKVSDNDRYLLSHNSSPERFQTVQDMQTYMKGVFDVLYTLELAEADIMLEKGKDYIRSHYRKLNSVEYDLTNNSDRVSNIQDDLGEIKSINDLVDKGILGRGIITGIYGNDDYIKLNMFDSHYGIMENNRGSSGGLTLRRVAYELLAEKGYYDGMLPYISAKTFYVAEDKTNLSGLNNVHSDTHILHQIFGNEYNSFKDFRKEMFRRRKEDAKRLKEITIWGKGLERITLRNYTDIVNVLRQAVNENNTFAIERVKRNILHEYLLKTNEFRTSIYK